MNGDLARYLAAGNKITTAMAAALHGSCSGLAPTGSPRTWRALRRAGLVGSGTALTSDGQQLGQALVQGRSARMRRVLDAYWARPV